jgi:hypothetical protein
VADSNWKCDRHNGMAIRLWELYGVRSLRRAKM